MKVTKLTKPVRRQAPVIIDNRKEPRPQDHVTVTLYPCGDIGFRARGRRKEVRIPLSVAYTQALRADAVAAKKAAKKGGPKC